MMKSKLFAIITIAALPFFMSSCGDDDNGIEWTPSGGGGTSVPTTNVTSRLECPQPKGDANEQIIAHWTRRGGDSIMTFCLAYDLQKLHSRWVAFRFDAKTRGKGSGRTEAWADDPSLAACYRIGTSTFGGGYARGHICASYDRQYSTEANAQTFYMTNMTPMNYDFNGCYWITLENHVQDLGRNSTFADTLYIVKGGTIANDKIIQTLSRGGGKTTVVPRYYYMALLRYRAGSYASIAFLLENKSYGYGGDKKAPLSEMHQHAISVNDLEIFTGINFFWNLPDSKEETIESQCNPSLWQM